MKALRTICVNSYFIIFWILNDPFHFLAIKFIEMWFLIAGLVNQTWDQKKKKKKKKMHDVVWKFNHADFYLKC